MKHRTPGQNARLSARAPEAIEALKGCVDGYGRYSLDKYGDPHKLLPESEQTAEIAEAMRVIRVAEGWPAKNVTIDHEATS